MADLFKVYNTNNSSCQDGIRAKTKNAPGKNKVLTYWKKPFDTLVSVYYNYNNITKSKLTISTLDKSNSCIIYFLLDEEIGKTAQINNLWKN